MAMFDSISYGNVCNGPTFPPAHARCILLPSVVELQLGQIFFHARLLIYKVHNTGKSEEIHNSRIYYSYACRCTCVLHLQTLELQLLLKSIDMEEGL